MVFDASASATVASSERRQNEDAKSPVVRFEGVLFIGSTPDSRGKSGKSGTCFTRKETETSEGRWKETIGMF